MRATEQEGQRFLGWRDVPVDPSVIGYVARECQPVIRQLFIGMGPGSDSAAFERKLFVIRKVAEREVLDAGLSRRRRVLRLQPVLEAGCLQRLAHGHPARGLLQGPG